MKPSRSKSSIHDEPNEIVETLTLSLPKKGSARKEDHSSAMKPSRSKSSIHEEPKEVVVKEKRDPTPKKISEETNHKPEVVKETTHKRTRSTNKSDSLGETDFFNNVDLRSHQTENITIHLTKPKFNSKKTR